MFLNPDEFPNDVEIEVPICIVGSGPAGLTLGLELKAFDGEVLILESGGVRPSPSAQELARGSNVGLPFLAPHISRCRAFGGTSARWAGICRTLDADDFVERPWIPFSGWPIRSNELTAYYARAARIAGLRDVDWNPGAWAHDASIASMLPLEGEDFFGASQYLTPFRLMGRSYYDFFRKSAHPKVCLGATITEIETNPAGTRVVRLRVRGRGGKRFYVKAKWFVLAMGGLENARLLLTSNRHQAQGLGNQNGLVGRFLMNHPQMAAAWITLKSPITRRAALHVAGIESQRVTATYDLMSAERIAKFSAYIFPARSIHAHPRMRSRGYSAALAALGRNPRASLFPNGTYILGTILEDLPGLARDIVSRCTRRFHWNDVLCVLSESEQVPNPESRVMLNRERDRYGLPTLSVHWKMTDLDKHTLRRGVKKLCEGLSRDAIENITYHRWLNSDDLSNFPGQEWAHHAGTTRMSDDPKRGVVDRNGRVHGVHNLFIAGCSVFPTEGMAPPTFTIIALASRLAKHLKDLTHKGENPISELGMGVTRPSAQQESAPSL